MNWRDEPLTKGEFVDALTAALQRNKRGSESILETYKGFAKHQPALYQILRLIFKCDEVTLETMRDYIMAEGAISDAISNGDHEQRDPDSGASGPGQP